MTDALLQQAFINHYQGGFPLSHRPFQELGEKLGFGEQQLINLVQRLLDGGILSRFGPLFDSKQMGGDLTLAAIEAPEHRYAEITRLVNSYPQVAHNYRREHRLNMWFVVATGNDTHIQDILDDIEHRSGLTVYNCPKQREFYVGLKLKLFDDATVITVPMDEEWIREHDDSVFTPDQLDRRLILMTQEGLPVAVKPYQRIAQQLEVPEHEVLARLGQMLEVGVIRRIGAVPNHYRLGLRANGMTVWDVPDDQAEQFGGMLGALDYVSHCYLRPRHRPNWPYNLFAMVHGGSRQQVLEKVARMEVLTGDNIPHDVLFSTAILKKTGLRLAA